MLKSKPILSTCQCLVGKGWRETTIIGASYDENPFRKNTYILSVDALVKDDKGVDGVVHSVYYDPEMIRNIVSDVSEITGKEAQGITVDDFCDINCYAYLAVRTSKKGKKYNQVLLFVSFEEYRESYLDTGAESDGSLDSESKVAATDVSNEVEPPCEDMETHADKCDVTIDSPEPYKENEDDYDFDDDEEYDFFDEED